MCLSKPCFDVRLHSPPMFHHLQQSTAGKPLFLHDTDSKIAACLYTCPFVLICKLFWHPPCTNFVIPEVLMDDGICRSTAAVQLVSYICDSNLSVLLNHSNLFNTVCCLWSDGLTSLLSETCSATLELFHQLVHLPFCNSFLNFVRTFFCESQDSFTPSNHKNGMTAHYSTMVKSKRRAHMFTL